MLIDQNANFYMIFVLKFIWIHFLFSIVKKKLVKLFSTINFAN